MKTELFVQDIFKYPRIFGSVTAFLLATVFFFTEDSVAFSIPLIILGIYLATSNSGIEIDLSERKCRVYKSHFGFRSGHWHSLEYWKGIVILKQHGRRNFRGPYLVSMSSVADTSYDICLVNETHRKQLLLKRTSFHDDALLFAQRMRKSLSTPIVKFNPLISDATKARKRTSKLKI